MGERLAEYLRFKGISQKKISKLSCVSESTISRFCAGGIITSDKLLRLLQVCDDLSLEWFFYETGEMIRRRGGDVTNNFGMYAGSVSGSSTNIHGSRNVRVNAVCDLRYSEMVMEKDRIILEKDKVIGERDATISRLLEGLRKG